VNRRMAIVLLMALGASGTARAQNANPAQSTGTGSDIEVARAQLAADRKAIVAQNLPLTDQESAAFWPVYDDYRAQMKKINDRKVALIKSYAGSYNSLTDQQALDMLKESQDINKSELDLKSNYVDKFKKVLPPKKVARYYQIESKLDAIVNYGLARDIPLAQ